MSKQLTDRNFDDLCEKFARKVYGGLKGDIRLAVIWRDLLAAYPAILESQPLRILDVGGGLGQFSIALAELGHRVVYNDLSAEMLHAAQAAASEKHLLDKIVWLQCPYQELNKELNKEPNKEPNKEHNSDWQEGGFDLVLSHAVIEWLQSPEKLIPSLSRFLAPQGILSLTFYNQNALEYRNLIRGNFKLLESSFSAHPGSLTPGTPLLPEQITDWVEQSGLVVDSSSGIRVFHDYVTTQRGGHQDADSVVEMELRYSLREPFKWLGRYIHFICSKTL